MVFLASSELHSKLCSLKEERINTILVLELKIYQNFK